MVKSDKCCTYIYIYVHVKAQCWLLVSYSCNCPILSFCNSNSTMGHQEVSAQRPSIGRCRSSLRSFMCMVWRTDDFLQCFNLLSQSHAVDLSLRTPSTPAPVSIPPPGTASNNGSCKWKADSETPHRTDPPALCALKIVKTTESSSMDMNPADIDGDIRKSFVGKWKEYGVDVAAFHNKFTHHKGYSNSIELATLSVIKNFLGYGKRNALLPIVVNSISNSAHSTWDCEV